MNKSIQSYWVTETGEWGSNEVETVDFEGHHEDIHEAFDFVSDWELPSWAAYLAKHPHEFEADEHDTCAACDRLVVQFHDSKLGK